MSWHADLQLEIAVEFQRLSTPHWERFEERAWRGLQFGYANWKEHGLWWRKTTVGRRYFAKYARERAARLKRIVVGLRKCLGCGESFEVSAHRVARHRDAVCSTSCRGRARANIKKITIDGKAKTLTEWCGLYKKVPLKTAWLRIKRGWNVRKALTTPLRGAT